MQNGFTHPKILDGWHRYRVGQHLGLVDVLVFEEFDGDSPVGFVLAENLHRRHLTASQRAQMVVEANEWMERCRPGKENASNDVLKTKGELAKEANVSTPTIDRAKQVSRAGHAEEVITGKKSASAVIQEVREKGGL